VIEAIVGAHDEINTAHRKSMSGAWTLRVRSVKDQLGSGVHSTRLISSRSRHERVIKSAILEINTPLRM
jgi:hypothetical protein